MDERTARRIAGIPVPPISVAAPPCLLLYLSFDADHLELSLLYTALLVVGLAFSSWATDRLENSEWRKKLRAEADTACVAKGDKAD